MMMVLYGRKLITFYFWEEGGGGRGSDKKVSLLYQTNNSTKIIVLGVKLPQHSIEIILKYYLKPIRV